MLRFANEDKIKMQVSYLSQLVKPKATPLRKFGRIQ